MKIKSRSLMLVAAISVLISAAQAQQQAMSAQDPGGWGPAKWGMTEQEVAAVIKGVKPAKNVVSLAGGEGPKIRLEWTKAVVHGIECTLAFAFDKSGGLARITGVPRRQTKEVVEKLQTGFTAEFGDPSVDEPSKVSTYATWKLPTTSIVLHTYDPLRDPIVRKESARGLPYLVPMTVMFYYSKVES